MIKNNFNFLSVMLFSSLIVGAYQLPLIENTLNKYGYENNINEKLPFSKDFQQLVEDQKISFSSLLNGESNYTSVVTSKTTIAVHSEENPVSHPVVIDTQKEPVVVSINMEKNNVTNPNTSINNSGSNISNDNLNTSTSNVTTQSSKNGACSDNCTILMIGDSVMGDIDFSMQRMIKKDFPSWKVIDGHKVSSGLTNQTYYDWPATAKKLVEKYKPDYVFVLLGTNDAQGMMFNGKGLAFSKESWVTEYSNRVNQIKNIIEVNQSSWYWIGLPVTKDKGFNSRLQVIRDIQSEQTKEHYISVEPIFGKNDHSEPINMKLRANDGIHLNSSGSDLVAKELLNKLKG